MLRLSVNRWGFTDKLFKIQLVREKAGFHGQNPFRETTIIRNSRGAHKKMRCVTRNEANTELD